MARSHVRGLASGYLFVYNLIMTTGWSLVLVELVKAYVSGRSLPLVYAAFSGYLRYFQTAALLEVLHSVFGIVRASPMTTAFQVASRIFVLWGVTEAVPSARATHAPIIMVVAWGLTEIARYWYFAVNSLGRPPYWLVWLRYSTFYLLYPMGAGGEAMTLFAALDEIKESGLGTIVMPNRWNFEFDYYWFCVFALCLYPLGLPYMYKHMIRQRRKYLSPKTEDESVVVKQAEVGTTSNIKKIN